MGGTGRWQSQNACADRQEANGVLPETRRRFCAVQCNAPDILMASEKCGEVIRNFLADAGVKAAFPNT